MTALPAEQRARGVVAATRGNHGAGLAYAGATLGVPVVICVPLGNNPEKNAAMRGFGAELVERGRDYDEAVEVALGLAKQRGPGTSANTFADGLATRSVYDLTWEPLRDGLAGFVAVPDPALADAIRVLLRTTHNLAEGAGAAGLAGLYALRERLANKTVA